MNKECEHEWGAEWTTTSVRDVRIICSKCGVSKLQNESIFPNLKKEADFHIGTNLEQINKQEWEDIENEFYKFTNQWG